nr:hypothetical protein [uncultured Rhodopila sp.]
MAGIKGFHALCAGFGALLLLAAGALAQSVAPAPPAGLAVHMADTDAEAANDAATALAKQVQNPIGNLFIFPFQGNTNFNAGTKGGTQEILKVQPVIPIHVNDDLTIITRTIFPLVWQPSYEPSHTVPFGTAPTQFSAVLSNAIPIDHFVFGAGPIFGVPTGSDRTFGSNVWGAGPEAVAVYIQGPWVAGLLVNGLWSFGGTTGRGGTQYSKLLIEPFVNYNFGGGWYISSAPLYTANWPAAGNHAWTVPFGGGGGKVVKLFGKLPVNLQVGAFYNAVHPSYTGAWTLRTQITLIF